MCMEDIRLGREMGYNTQGVIVAAAGTTQVEANPNRVGLIFSCSGTAFGQVNVDEVRTDTVIAYLQPGYNTLELDIKKHGQLVTKRFLMGNASSINMNLAITEILLYKR